MNILTLGPVQQQQQRKQSPNKKPSVGMTIIIRNGTNKQQQKNKNIKNHFHAMHNHHALNIFFLFGFCVQNNLNFEKSLERNCNGR